jgi:hypothetical protein
MPDSIRLIPLALALGNSKKQGQWICPDRGGDISNGKNSLGTELLAYGDWRSQLNDAIKQYRDWLRDGNLSDLRTHHQLERILTALNDDNLLVAFVAEYSRGKTELINTIFFGHLKRRILPSGSGRTTMCPTQIQYNPNLPPTLKLLPIETRADSPTMSELLEDPDAWQTIELDPRDSDQIAVAFKHMTDVIHVSTDEAERLDLPLSADSAHEYGMMQDAGGEVEIPRWRHAIVNLPHPLLEQGLVILDTPGLNALGAEPELTINQLSAAHAVVFILATDTGVTKSDLELWDDHIKLGGENSKEGSNDHSRLIALNKIDTLWDDMRTDGEIESEIRAQVSKTAEILKIPAENIFPVSAQKGLYGKITHNDEIVRKSRIDQLEGAIANSLIPAKQEIIRQNVSGVLDGVITASKNLITRRLDDVDEHMEELKELSTKNIEVVEHIMSKVQNEKTSLENHMQRFQAIRTVFTKQTNKLFNHLNLEVLDRLIAETKRDMTNSVTTISLQKCISDFLNIIQASMDAAINQSKEVIALSEDIHKDFQEEHGLGEITPRPLLLGRYKQQITRLESKHSHLKRTRNLFFKAQMSITNRFFNSVVSVIRNIYGKASKDAQDWSKSLMLPLESQVREHHTQLRRRLESVKRIHKASDTLENRLDELEAVRNRIVHQQTEMDSLTGKINDILDDGVPVEEDMAPGDDAGGLASAVNLNSAPPYKPV